MKISIRQFLRDLENYKIYHIIILSVVVFSLVLFNGFYQMQVELENLIDKNRIAISKDIDYTIHSWIEERINNLESSIRYMDKDLVLEDEDNLKVFIDTFLDQNPYFDVIHVLIPNYFSYVNLKKTNDYRTSPSYVHTPSGIDPLKTQWFLNTKESMKTTITVVPKHAHLLERAINICTPIASKEAFIGVMCGVLKADYVFQKIEKLQLPHEAYFFIISSDGKILSSSHGLANKKEIEENFLKSFDFTQPEYQELAFHSHFVSFTKMKHFDWYVGIGVDEKKMYGGSLQKALKYGLILFACFALFLAVASGAYEFMRRRAELKQQEYELLLSHRSRLAEIGELISGFNHQLRQPINSLSLMLSNILQLSSNRMLEQEMLEESIVACQKSVQMIDRTIILFRNFYRSSEEITRFLLSDCLRSILHIVFTDFVRHNINFDLKEQEPIKMKSIENFVQQIVLVLIQNAKDAILEKELKNPKSTNKRILLETSLKDGVVTIDITDHGNGVDANDIPTLFTSAKRSKKKKGSGIGLFFAKRLAINKLGGDLVLHNPRNPTVFRLTIVQDIRN